MSLSPVQEEIVVTAGNLIVRASAGTGKTYTMVSKIAQEIHANKSHKVIAAITFTIKAAKEIKDRIAIDVSQHFIGTNNSFAIEEIIKPFLKDVYGRQFHGDFSTDYSVKIDTFKNGLQKIEKELTLCSYRDTKKNFIFELAKHIVENSSACRLYLQAKYFKIYIDEYQDCDKDMHDFFMYLCDDLEIETFVVGDEKQSIYMWRGAYPEAFKSIGEKPTFKRIFMGDNYRSCQQIQNYSNLLCEETRCLYRPVKSIENIICLFTNSQTWVSDVMKYVDVSETSALLRYSNDNAKNGAVLLTQQGMECTYIPPLPIADITTEAAWLYLAIAKYIILNQYSVYDLISEIPVEGETSKTAISAISDYLSNIEISLEKEGVDNFEIAVRNLATYLGYPIQRKHVEKLYQTIINSEYHVAFQVEKYNHVAITFHSSKGLEFDQVIIFAEDYRLSDMASICNHYVAVTRAKSKLIIVATDDYNSKLFLKNIDGLLSESNLCLNDIALLVD